MRSFSRLMLCGFALLSSAQAADKQEFNMRIETEPPTLDWNLATDYVSINILYHLIEGLAEYNDKLEPVPSLASWKISKDGKTYTYTLISNTASITNAVPLRSDDAPNTVRTCLPASPNAATRKSEAPSSTCG